MISTSAKSNIELIKKAAEEIGKIQILDKKRKAYRIFYKNKSFIITRKFLLRRNLYSPSSLTKFKDLTNKLLKEADLSIPKFRIFNTSRSYKTGEIEKMISELKPPLIAKDTSGSNSRGIFPNIKTHSDALKILKENLPTLKTMLIQEMVVGKEYRVLVLGKKAVGVLEMIPPQIRGNGKDKTSKLIKNFSKKIGVKISPDKPLKILLEEQGEKLSSIPRKNKSIYLRKNSSLAEGGRTRDCTETIHPEFTKICREATIAVGLDLAGIDLICSDINKSPKKQTYWILEINGKPDIFIHYLPSFGKPREVAKDIIRYIAKKHEK